MFETLLNIQVTLHQLCKLDLSTLLLLLLFTLGIPPLMSTKQHYRYAEQKQELKVDKMVATPFHQLKTELVFNLH